MENNEASSDANAAAESELLLRLRDRTARCLSDTPEADLLAAALKRWREAQSLDTASLAESLGVSLDGLNQLALCRPPRPERFAEDVIALAAYTGCDPDRLRSLLRRMQIMGVFAAATEHAPATDTSRGGASGQGILNLAGPLLIAARDRAAEEEQQAKDGSKDDNGE